MSSSTASHPSPRLDILVSGAGIAGTVTAFFLARAGHRVTIIERSPSLRASGQSIDVRGHGITVLRRMGAAVEADVRAKISREQGFKFVDRDDRVVAEFPVEEGAGLTGEIEILRGELAMVLFDAAKGLDGVEAVFGKSVTALDQQGDKVNVQVTEGWPTASTGDAASRAFDIVIAADGWASKTRSLAFGSDVSSAAIKSLGQWGGWCTIPYASSDIPWARWYNAPRGRMIMIRPDNEQVTRVSLWTMTRDPAIADKFPQLIKDPPEEQKAYFRQLFADAGWEADRITRAMQDADDFYVQQVAQVYMDSWSEGRVALVGDAAACPSPISGMGTSVAIVGAYVLAGEIIRNPEEPQVAFKRYEKTLRPFVRTAQKVVPGAPGIACPETEWGIWILNSILGFVSWTKVYKLFGRGFSPPASAMDMPDYGI